MKSTAVWIDPSVTETRPTVTNFGNQGIAPNKRSLQSVIATLYPNGWVCLFCFCKYIHTPAGHGPWENPLWCNSESKMGQGKSVTEYTNLLQESSFALKLNKDKNKNESTN